MKITLIGCGMMGRATAHALAQSGDSVDLTVVDADDQRAESLASWASELGARARASSDLEAALAAADAAALALPWPASLQVIEQAVKHDTPLASIARPRTDELPRLTAVTEPAQVPMLLPVGLEPGLAEILTIYLAEKLDHVREVRTYCGCVLREPRGPLGYTILFGGDELPIVPGEVFLAKAGQLEARPRFSEVEEVFIEGAGMLEAHLDGMVPWLPEHPLLRAADCFQKTLRWPGYAERIQMLLDTGLLGMQPVDVDGVSVVPKRVVDKCLAPWVAPRPEDRDIGILDISVLGQLEGRPATARALVTDHFDDESGLSAMARLTGITLAACTKMLASGLVKQAGWAQPHRALTPELVGQLLDQLQRQGIRLDVGVRHGAAELAAAGD